MIQVIWNKGIEIVLILACIQLIFFIVASVGLCFGFMLKTLLITQSCFSYCLLSSAYRAKAFSAHHTTKPVNSLRVDNKLEGDTAGAADPN